MRRRFHLTWFVLGCMGLAATSARAAEWNGKWSNGRPGACAGIAGRDAGLVDLNGNTFGIQESGGDIKKVTHRDGMYILDVIYNTGQSDGAAEPGKVYIKIANGGQAAQISFDSPTKWQPYTRCK